MKMRYLELSQPSGDHKRSYHEEAECKRSKEFSLMFGDICEPLKPSWNYF
jgi:hypothetical protein